MIRFRRLTASIGLLSLFGLAAHAGLISISGGRGVATSGGGGGAAAYYTGTLRQPTCSDASIDSAISASSSGDIVRMASACSSMTVSISIPSSKGILFDGNGSTFNSSSTIDISPNASISTRVTNFTWACGDSHFTTGGSPSSAKWRIDHVSLTSHSHRCILTGAGYGLIDHVTVSTLQDTEEFIHNEAGPSPCNPASSSYSQCGWDTALTPGSVDAIYFEDNDFGCSSCGNPAWIQSYYGARVVYRYNTFRWVFPDHHGTGGNVGTRWYEGYNNTFLRNGGTNSGRGMFNNRAGSGMLFNNTRDSAYIDVPGWCEEDSGYPAAYQIGRGQSGALIGAYTWGNPGTDGVGCSDSANNGSIQLNRDLYSDDGASCTAGGSCTTGIGTGTTLPTTCTSSNANVGFWKTDAGGDWDTTHGGANDGAFYKCTATDTWTLYYTPYTYPHPLQAGLEPDK